MNFARGSVYHSHKMKLYIHSVYLGLVWGDGFAFSLFSTRQWYDRD